MNNLQIIEALCIICCRLARMVYELAVQNGQSKSFEDLKALSDDYRDAIGEELLDSEILKIIREA